MNEKKVYLVYEGDQWLSTCSLYPVAVCSDFEHVLKAVECIAVGHGLKYRKDLPDDYDGDSVEAAVWLFEECFNYLGKDFGITYEEVELDDMPYKE